MKKETLATFKIDKALTIVEPNGLSEGTELVKSKDGRYGIIRRSTSGSHYGVQILDEEELDVLKRFVDSNPNN